MRGFGPSLFWRIDMRNFARSQIDRVENRTRPNKPVNMDLAKTYYPAGSREDTYTIVFEFLANDSMKYVSWHYPPTETGRRMRDNDIAFLNSTFAVQCTPNFMNKKLLPTS
jgi:hypothetical protein